MVLVLAPKPPVDLIERGPGVLVLMYSQRGDCERGDFSFTVSKMYRGCGDVTLRISARAAPASCRVWARSLDHVGTEMGRLRIPVLNGSLLPRHGDLNTPVLQVVSLDQAGRRVFGLPAARSPARFGSLR